MFCLILTTVFLIKETEDIPPLPNELSLIFMVPSV